MKLWKEAVEQLDVPTPGKAQIISRSLAIEVKTFILLSVFLSLAFSDYARVFRCKILCRTRF